MAYVTIPKDLSRIQSKVLFGLTKRQVICFGAAALVGVPLFFLAKASLGTTTAALCMILVMLPFFLFAMYEKNGQPLEVFLGHLIQNKFIRPKVRIYQTNNLYSALVRQSQLEQDLEQCFKRYATNRTCSFYLTNEVDTFPDPLRKDLLCHPRLFSVICDLQAQSDIAFWKLRLHNITS